MAKKEKNVNKIKKPTKERSEEEKKRDKLLIVLFVILMVVAGALFYFLYLKPPTPQTQTQTQTSILNQVLKNINIDPVRDEIEKRRLIIPPLETNANEIGKENPFIP
jgi:flagellar basal body-associated protein FliL